MLERDFLSFPLSKQANYSKVNFTPLGPQNVSKGFKLILPNFMTTKFLDPKLVVIYKQGLVPSL